MEPCPIHSHSPLVASPPAINIESASSQSHLTILFYFKTSKLQSKVKNGNEHILHHEELKLPADTPYLSN